LAASKAAWLHRTWPLSMCTFLAMLAISIWGQCYDYFRRFSPIFGEKLAFFFKTNIIIFLSKLAVFWIIKSLFFAQFFGENIFKIKHWPLMSCLYHKKVSKDRHACISQTNAKHNSACSPVLRWSVLNLQCTAFGFRSRREFLQNSEKSVVNNIENMKTLDVNNILSVFKRLLSFFSYQKLSQ
jgi:hypothetical protein